MKSKNHIGILICLLLFLIGFSIHGNIGLYFNFTGLLIVVAGSCGAALISYRYDKLHVVYKVVRSSYKNEPKDPKEIVEILVDLAVKTKFKGLISLQKDEAETSVLFLRQALGFLVDGYSGQEIRSLLTGEMSFFKHRRQSSEQVLKHIADYFPAFGLAGSVVGLIGILNSVGDTQAVIATVPIALTSTLYGIIFANFFFLPFAANLREQTNKELLLQKIIMEGVIAIESNLNPRVLERKLKSFLTPSSREGEIVSLVKIQKRFKINAPKVS